MKRKVILHGPSSLCVSLPSKWAKQNNVEKGCEIDVLDSGKQLIISAGEKKKDIMKTTVSFQNLSLDTRKDLLTALHKKGYDEIRIDHTDDDSLRQVYEFLNTSHLGFEIIKQGDGFFIIRNVSIPEENQFENLFRRIFRILIEYCTKIEQILADRDATMTQSHLLHNSTISRISVYCKRILVKDPRDDASFYYSIIESIEAISLHLSRVLENLDNEDCYSDEAVRIFTGLRKGIEETYTLFYSYSNERYDTLRISMSGLDKEISRCKAGNEKETACTDLIDGIFRELMSIQPSVLAIKN